MSWPMVALGDIFEIARGGSPRPISEYITTAEDGLNWIKIGDATASSKFIHKTKEKIRPEGLKKTRQVKPGDFLLTNSMSFGRPYIMATDGCIHDGWLVLKPRADNFDADYFYHLLSSDGVFATFSGRAGGSTVKNLNSEIVASVEIPLPPLDEQKRIAGILDRADALRRKRRDALALLDTLTQSIFVEMFGEKLASSSSLPTRNPLSDFAEIQSGITKGRKLKGQSTREVNYLAVSNVQDKHLNMSIVKTIEATDAEIDRFRLEKDDLLLTEGGDPDKLGRGTLWNDELPLAIHQNHIFRVRISSDEVRPIFLNWLLGSTYGKAYFLKSAKQTTGIASINKTQLSAFPMFVPSLELQAVFEKKNKAIDDMRKRFGEIATNLDSLFASLQSRAFSGKL